ncbi:MAG: hypothetical protein IT430_09795 [Phycisphaerales bacterium]|nr:hypothetical protein [Phycisphaerales bacterium]
MFTLATNSMGWNSPAWLIVLMCLGSFLSFVSAAGVTVIGWYIYGVRDRMGRIEDRLERGDEKFEEIVRDQATAAVDVAMKNGDVREQMYRNFVTREEFEKHADRMTGFETETLKGMASVGTKLDLLLRREEARHDT